MANPKTPKPDKTLKHREGRNILYIELRSPYPERLRAEAEREHRSMKAQAEVIVMKQLDAADSAA